MSLALLVMNLTSHPWDRRWDTQQSLESECGIMASLVNGKSASPDKDQICSLSGTCRSTQYEGIYCNRSWQFEETHNLNSRFMYGMFMKINQV